MSNFSIPAVFASRGGGSIGYGCTGSAALYAEKEWTFFPDEAEVSLIQAILCLEEELFFPQNPGGLAPGAFNVCESSYFEVLRSAWIQAEIKHHLALKRAAEQTLVVQSWSRMLWQTCYVPTPFQTIAFPWGAELVLAKRLKLGFRTACPLFGEWELVDLGSGDGLLTFRKVVT